MTSHIYLDTTLYCIQRTTQARHLPRRNPNVNVSQQWLRRRAAGLMARFTICPLPRQRPLGFRVWVLGCKNLHHPYRETRPAGAATLHISYDKYIFASRPSFIAQRPPAAVQVLRHGVRYPTAADAPLPPNQSSDSANVHGVGLAASAGRCSLLITPFFPCRRRQVTLPPLPSCPVAKSELRQRDVHGVDQEVRVVQVEAHGRPAATTADMG